MAMGMGRGYREGGVGVCGYGGGGHGCHSPWEKVAHACAALHHPLTNTPLNPIHAYQCKDPALYQNLITNL